jgi:signal transduction histidine kinase
MLISAAPGRIATLLRLVGLGLISWSIFASRAAPAASGRGLVSLVAFVAAAAAWLVWTFWSVRRPRITADLYVLAVAGGLAQMSAPDSAASAFAFVVAMAAAARAGLVNGLVVAALGAVALGVGAILYHHSSLGVLAYALGFAAVALGGSNIRQSRQRLEQTELLLAQTQRSHEEQLRSARLEESARIARDIHDVLAHALAGLVIQLEATDALLAQGADRDAIRARVQRAHALAREGLQETRRAVGALRGDGAVATTPVAAVRTLIEQYEGPIELQLSGNETRLQGEVGEAVLRVIQEALTNVRKHAPGSEVRVGVQVGDAQIEVAVENHALAPVRGSSLASAGGGYGLQGMRERAAQLGGTLEAGPTSEGWRVVLCLPLDEARSER